MVHQYHEPISVSEFIKVVKAAKRWSTSSIYSRRTYATYKCLIKSPTLTSLYVRFLNVVIKNKHILARWLDIVDVVLEKGKGPRVDKLRIIQLIEADLQLFMRIAITNRTVIVAEKSNRLSCANFGNRKGYDISTAILEKTLIHNITYLNDHPTIHYIDDRQACYDRQLPEVGLLVERSFGMPETQAMLLQTMLKNFKHYLATAYGTSKNFYGGHSD